MTSWLTWPLDWLARRVSRHRVEEIKKALEEKARVDEEETSFVDAEEWAQFNHINKDEAEEDLERGVKNGILERMWRYEGSDSPITFVVPESWLNKPVLLSDIGYVGDDDREVVVSPYSSRKVYVAAGS
jgi:hypothetical protein